MDKSDPKHRNVTAQDVADRAGVSRAAVSRTFSNNGSVSQSTREKVLAAAEALGYQVNILAQSLNRQRSTLVGVVVTRLSDPFRGALLEQLLQEIQAAGFQALVSEISPEDELDDTLRRFTQFRVSGVIVTSGQPPTTLVNECVRLNIPVVAINRESTLANVDIVKSDNRSGAAMAAQQLLSSGCRRLGWVNVPDSTWSGLARAESFRRALGDPLLSGEVSLSNLTASDVGYQGGWDAANALLESGDTLDGVFCANALIACGFLDAMRANGNLQAPDDFHLIGFDDTPQTRYHSYQLSTLRQDVALLAQRALDCLRERASDPQRPQRVESVPVELVLRHTSPALPSANTP